MADSAAFEILYKEYYPRVFALCRRLLLRAKLQLRSTLMAPTQQESA